MEKIIWTDRVSNERLLCRVKEERNILHTVQRGKVRLIGHVVRWNCIVLNY
jgi:hypothetical protein